MTDYQTYEMRHGRLMAVLHHEQGNLIVLAKKAASGNTRVTKEMIARKKAEIKAIKDQIAQLEQEHER